MKKRRGVQRRSNAVRRSKILEAYRQSDLTQREFAREHKIGLSTLGFWLRKAAVNGSPQNGQFIRLPNLVSSSSGGNYQVRFPNGLALQIDSGFREEELARLLPILQRA